MVQRFDLAIVGGSFAGLACARSAALRGLKVAVLDAKPDPGLRVQTTGIVVKEASDAFDVSREPKHILDMYGPGTQARQILIARRLLERGVRFVQVWHGEGQPWDSHEEIEQNHKRLAGECDQGIGALLKDLKQRGLLEETLVLWTGEFGRLQIPANLADADAGADARRAGAGVHRGLQR